MIRKRTWPNVLSWAVIIILLLMAAIFSFLYVKQQLSQPHIPEMNITLNGVSLDTIDSGSKDTEYPYNTITITDNHTTTRYHNVEIKGRGNSTWVQNKKPYQLTFNQKTNLFDLGTSRKWILLANNVDTTYLRNDTAFYLANILGEAYPVSGKFIELYVSGKYHGLYYIVPKIEINKSSVNLKDPYGILVELENLHVEQDCYRTTSDDCLIIKDSVNKDNEVKAMQSFVHDYNAFLQALKQKNYSSIANLIDVDSFARYYLLSEFSSNPDAYLSSFYMYKNGENDKIHAGPGWDFDLAFASRRWPADNEAFYSPYTTNAIREHAQSTPRDSEQNSAIVTEPITNYSTIFFELLDLPEFRDRVDSIYQATLLPRQDELINHLKSQIEYIRPFALRDYEKWGIPINEYDIVTSDLLDWVAARCEHFKEQYGPSSNSSPQESSSDHQEPSSNH